MDRATFMETLRRYPRVRDSDFVLPPRSRAPVRRSFPHDTAALKDAELAAAMLDDVDEAGGAATVRYDAVHAAPEFWSALRAFLQTHFSEEDAAEVERRFEAAHYAFAEGLSAEDLEDVAAATAPPVPPQ